MFESFQHFTIRDTTFCGKTETSSKQQKRNTHITTREIQFDLIFPNIFTYSNKFCKNPSKLFRYFFFVFGLLLQNKKQTKKNTI